MVSSLAPAKEAPASSAFDVPAACDALRRFLISVTAKDVSIMITMELDVLPSGCDAHPPHQVKSASRALNDECKALHMHTTSVSFSSEATPALPETTTELQIRYRVAVADLDPKPLSKVPHYHALDQEIVRHFTKTALS